MNLSLYKAKVIDIEDKDKQGKIKIKILPEMEKMEDKVLPFAIPFNISLSEKTMSLDLPQKDELIYVLVDEYWKRFYYLPGNPYFYERFKWDDKIKEILDKIEDIEELNKDYEKIKFTLYPDGDLEYHNNEDGSHGFYHKEGTYNFYDKDGNFYLHLADDKTFNFANKEYKFGELLKSLLESLRDLETCGSPSTHKSPKLKKEMEDLLDKMKSLFKMEDE